MEEIILYKAYDGTIFDERYKCEDYEKQLDCKINPQLYEKEILPHREVGSTFECDGHTLIVRECTDEFEDCLHKCFFRKECLQTYDLHGPCAATDIGRLKSIYFEELS